MGLLRRIRGLLGRGRLVCRIRGFGRSSVFKRSSDNRWRTVGEPSENRRIRQTEAMDWLVYHRAKEPMDWIGSRQRVVF